MSEEKEMSVGEALFRGVGAGAGATAGAVVAGTLVAAASPVAIPVIAVGAFIGTALGYNNPAGTLLQIFGIWKDDQNRNNS